MRKCGKTLLTDFLVDHENHVINEMVFRQDSAKPTQESKDVIKNLLEGQCKQANIQKALQSKGIHLSKNQIKYQVDKILGSPASESDLSSFIKGTYYKVSKFVPIPFH